MHTPFHSLRSLTAALATLAASPCSASVIAYNFTETDGNSSQTLDGTTPKGPLGTTVWNDSYVRTSGTVAAGTETSLLDGDGNTTSAAISWTSKETWFGDGGNTTQDQRIVLGYLDDGDSGSGNPGVFISLSDIPYASYNVYCIVGTDHGSSTTFPVLDFLVNGTTWAFGGSSAVNATAFANMEATSANGTWTQIIPGVQTGNYWMMGNLSGSTLTIDGQLGINNVARGSISAIIIEQVPEPSSALLVGLSGAFLLRRRRG